MERLYGAGFTREGFIVDQAKLTGVPYGRRTSDYNGCGWIAVYNFLRVHGIDAPVPALTRRMARHSLLRARLGTSPLRVKRMLRRFGFPTRFRLCKRGEPAPLAGAESGVVLYRHATGWHFVAFRQTDEPGKWHFYNALPGNEAHRETMEAFLAKNAKRPYALLFVFDGRQTACAAREAGLTRPLAEGAAEGAPPAADGETV